MVDKLSGQVELIEVSSRRGRSATIAIGTITTGAAGTSASVTNVGTSGEAVFNFTIPRGDAVELRISGGYLQWKNTTAVTWTNILEIADITATIDIGTVVTGNPGTDVLVTNSGAGKDAVFNFAIPRGDSVELRIDSGYIQWKYTADEVWNNLYAISAITPTITVGTVTTGNAGTNVAVTNSGTDKDGIFNFTIPRGDDVQLRISEGYFQWKNTTASTWNNIYAISDITATIEVGTVTTGDADSSVTFTNVGSGKDAIFNLSIPKGTTFTPSVSAEGVISFTNDGGLSNPAQVDIKGDNSYIHIKWHTEGSQTLLDVADDYIGIYVDHTPADSEVYADYTWFKYKGDPGNLTGPATSTDGNVPIFDGVGGDLLKDSGVKLSDKADVTDVANALALKTDVTYTEYLMMEGDPA